MDLWALKQPPTETEQTSKKTSKALGVSGYKRKLQEPWCHILLAHSGVSWILRGSKANLYYCLLFMNIWIYLMVYWCNEYPVQALRYLHRLVIRYQFLFYSRLVFCHHFSQNFSFASLTLSNKPSCLTHWFFDRSANFCNIRWHL